MGHQATILCLQTEHVLRDLPEREKILSSSKHRVMQIKQHALHKYAIHTHTVYLIADSSCNVAYFNPGRLPNMKAFPVKVSYVDIHP